MVLWIVFAVLAVLTLAFVLRPLLMGSGALVGGSDEVVYAAQLEEIEADRTRGVIGDEEAQAARTEVARRLLRAHRSGARAATSGRPRRAMALALVVLVPAFTVGAYLTLGVPGYGDRPLASRTPPVESEVAVLLAQAEERLAANPEEGEGWAAVAPIYLRMRRFSDAADAYARAIDLLGDEPQLLTGRGQALMFAAGGTVTDEALTYFQRANAAAPDAVAPKVFLAVADRQRGDIPSAAARWRDLIATSDGTEPWLAIAQSEIAAIREADTSADAGVAPTVPSAGAAGAQGPSGATSEFTPPRAAMAAIAALPADQQAAQIENMVAGLAARLEDDGGSVDEWVRLVRSYRVLGREEDAAKATERALAALDESDRAAFTAAVGPTDP